MIPVHFGHQPVKNDQPANDVGEEARPGKVHFSNNIVIETSAGNDKELIKMEYKIPESKAGKK